MTQPDTLHARLRAEIDRRLAVARAADAAKPGEWVAVTTHDGTGYDGLSRVLAVQVTADRTISRHVADGISDIPEPVRAGFEDDEPEAAEVAEHIALHDPADATRRYQGELELLERHAPRLDAEDAGMLSLLERLALHRADRPSATTRPERRRSGRRIVRTVRSIMIMPRALHRRISLSPHHRQHLRQRRHPSRRPDYDQVDSRTGRIVTHNDRSPTRTRIPKMHRRTSQKGHTSIIPHKT